MIVVDTSIWIEYLRGNKFISKVFNELLYNRKVVAVSAVFGELLQGVKDSREDSIINGFWKNLPSESEDELFIEAGILSNEYKLISEGVGIVDCYILAFALKYDFAIWTLDKKMQKAMDRIEMKS